ncbi:hypothetical protein PoB_007192100 [Plakobranchus ocellatus]|uniref:Uncharacterized protein n=1 Tax=Plakobranchus ocellatus TaxID=259542 RepID=A0AAV4DNA8_9GAST|nr:hypothetical protein PoB_007192100 [Plakobranchus ocellatus]
MNILHAALFKGDMISRSSLPYSNAVSRQTDNRQQQSASSIKRFGRLSRSLHLVGSLLTLLCSQAPRTSEKRPLTPAQLRAKDQRHQWLAPVV